MMKTERAMGAAVEAGTEHYSGDLADRDKIVDLIPVARIILEIGVLDHQDVNPVCSAPPLPLLYS